MTAHDSRQVAVVGGGILGASTASALARLGAQVTEAVQSSGVGRSLGLVKLLAAERLSTTTSASWGSTATGPSPAAWKGRRRTSGLRRQYHVARSGEARERRPCLRRAGVRAGAGCPPTKCRC